MDRLMKGFVLIMATVLLSSCHTYRREMATGPGLAINNTYTDPAYNHSQVTNVLLLPLENTYGAPEFELHRQKITTSLVRNFGKFGYFNLHFDPQYSLTAGHIVDVNSGLVDRIKLGEVGQMYNVQAVLQMTVDEFRPYPPLRMKVKALLIDANSGEKIWAFDHAFDTDDREAVNALRLWWNGRVAGGDVRNHFEASRVRPTVFTNFVFYTMARSYGFSRHRAIEVVNEEKAAAEVDPGAKPLPKRHVTDREI